MIAAPVLETERLIMRGPEPRDCAGFCAFMTSERSRYAGGVLDQKSAWRAFCVELGHWDMRGFGMWAVTLKGDEACVGLVGCWYPEGKVEKELGWILWDKAEGRGIGYEAAARARRHIYEVLGWPTIVSYIAEPNMRSRALAERLGAHIDPDAVHGLSDDTLVYRHPAPETLQ